jgi:hypothetical protein
MISTPPSTLYSLKKGQLKPFPVLFSVFAPCSRNCTVSILWLRLLSLLARQHLLCLRLSPLRPHPRIQCEDLLDMLGVQSPDVRKRRPGSGRQKNRGGEELKAAPRPAFRLSTYGSDARTPRGGPRGSRSRTGRRARGLLVSEVVGEMDVR